MVLDSDLVVIAAFSRKIKALFETLCLTILQAFLAGFGRFCQRYRDTQDISKTSVIQFGG